MPAPPPIRKTAEVMKQKCVSDGGDTPLTDTQINALINDGKIFLGHVKEMDVEFVKKKTKVKFARRVPIRLLDPRVQLISHVRNLLQKGILVPSFS